MMQVDRRDNSQQMHALLNEKQWRQYLALEAKERGSVAQVAQEAQVSQNTVRRGIREVEAGEGYTPGQRQRAQGGGRKKESEKDPTLLSDREGLLEPKGDRMSLLKWTGKSVAHLKAALHAMGHPIADTALREVLLSPGSSLRAKKKNVEGSSHEDRDAHFAQIKERCQHFEQQGTPIISVDGKQKELLGTFQNNGREWQARGEETEVNVSDFLSLADGKAIPYGVSDLGHHRGFVNVGIDHDPAEFAGESIRRWWQQSGKALSPEKGELLITADGGGSNGVSNRLWKKKLQDLANEEQMAITVVHYPPATSKWNKIEHRLFAFLSIHWRAKPLTSLEVVLELISHTTTTEGVTVTAVKDSQTSPTGLKVTDEELAALNLVRDAFHGEWNSPIKPQAR